MSTAAQFDTNYYLTNNADVVVAISQGQFSSALDHFSKFGGRELRQPNSVFNSNFYAINNADVLNAVGAGDISSVFAHYQTFGESENRAPNTNFSTFTAAAYLAANADVAAAVTAGDFSSALDHYIAFGQNEVTRTGSGVAASAITSNPGTTFTLTIGSDQGADFTGGSGNDVYTSLIDDNTPASNTLGSLDVLNGGAGTDTLQITGDVSAGGLTLPAASITNIENYLLRNVSGQTFTFNASLVGGEELITNDRSANAVTLQNLTQGTSVEQRGNEVTINGALIAGYVNAATSATLNISNGVTAGAIQVNGNGLTSLVINSLGTADNIVGNITSTDNPTAITINATKDLTTTGIVVASNAAAQSLTVTGGGDIVLGTLDTDFATIDASATSKTISATLSATVAAAYTGGSGVDSISTSTTGQTGVVDGGAGSDLLILTSTSDLNVAAEGAVYQNFETLRVANDQVANMTLVTGSTIGAIQLVDSSTNTTTVNNMNATQAANITYRDFHNTSTLTVTGSGVVGSIDVVNITISDGDAIINETLSGSGTDGMDLIMAGVETLNFTVTDNFDMDAMNQITGMNSLSITGSGAVDIITGAVDMGANGSVDFGGATGAVAYNATAQANNAFAYTGSSGIDTFIDNVVGGNQINTGAGNDVLTLIAKTGTQAVNSVTMGAGQDDVTMTIIGNDARDQVKFIFAAGDSISDSSTTGISATLTDSIIGIDGTTAATGAGASLEFDTNVQATAVTAGSAAVTLGTTTVTNGGDFFVHIASATVANVYQDTDGDSIIEAGEFALLLSSVDTNTLLAADFAVTGGDLILITT